MIPQRLQARRIINLLAGLIDPSLRLGWLRENFALQPTAEVVRLLDHILLDDSERAIRARTAVTAWLGERTDQERESLLRQAGVFGLSHLEKLLGSKVGLTAAAQEADEDQIERIAVDPQGRAFTLGERKSLARRPPAHLFEKMLRDPSPEVITLLLASPTMTEDHVVRLASRRPNRSSVLNCIASHPRWSLRIRVRRTLVLQPSTPLSHGLALVNLLSMAELRDVADAPDIHDLVRQAASSRLKRLTLPYSHDADVVLDERDADLSRETR